MQAVRRRILPFVAGLIVASPLSGQDVAPSGVAGDTAGELVHLTFDWPVGLSARVEFTLQRIDVRGIGHDTMRIEGTYAMRTEEHPRGLIVQTENFSAISLDDTNADRQAVMRELVMRLSSVPTGYVISPDGLLLEVKGLQEARREMLATFEPMLDELGPAALEARRMLAEVVSEELLLSAATEQWSAIVGLWADRELQAGWIYTAEAVNPLPVLDREITFAYEISLLGRADCATGEKTSDGECVQLSMVSQPEEEALQAVIDEALPAFVIDGEPVQESRMHLDMTVYVWLSAEPDGLIPHVVEIGRTLDTSGGPPGTVSQSVVSRYVYHYDE